MGHYVQMIGQILKTDVYYSGIMYLLAIICLCFAMFPLEMHSRYTRSKADGSSSTRRILNRKSSTRRILQDGSRDGEDGLSSNLINIIGRGMTTIFMDRLWLLNDVTLYDNVIHQKINENVDKFGYLASSGDKLGPFSM